MPSSLTLPDHQNFGHAECLPGLEGNARSHVTVSLPARYFRRLSAEGNPYDVFTPTNLGLPHIQTLRIKDWCTPIFNNHEHLHVLCYLLTVIPRNKLRIFESVEHA